MNDDELDRRLLTVREHTEHLGVRHALEALGRGVRVESTTAPRRTKLNWGVGLGIAAIALTAGTTTTAYYLGVPPFQSLPDGASRTSESIPLDYDMDDGTEIRCRVFLEFENVDAPGVAAVDAAIRTTDWTDFGQDLYDAQVEPPDDSSAEGAVSDATVDATFAFAAMVIPGLGFMSDGAEDSPLLSAVATTCRPDAR